MKNTLSTLEAVNELGKYDCFNSFTYEGTQALVEYIESIEEDCGTEIEFDPVAIRCEFSEYESAIEAAAQYTSEFTTEEAALEYLEDHTSVITYDGGVIIQDF